MAAIVRIIDAVGTAGTDAIDDICRDAREYALTGKLDLAFHSLERALQLQDEGQSATEQKAETATRSEADEGGGVRFRPRARQKPGRVREGSDRGTGPARYH